MQILDEVKQSILDGIEKEREIANLKYDKERKVIEYTNSVPLLLKQLVEIYGNSLNQKEKMVEVLNGFLEADFFKKAINGRGDHDIVKGANYLFYRYGEYYVGFATSRVHTINVGRTQKLKKPFKPIQILDNWEKGFMKTWNRYLEKEVDYDFVINEYSEITRSKSAGYFFKSKMKRSKEIENHVKSIQNKIDNFEEKTLQWEKNMKDYEIEKEDFDVMIKEINKDLEKFRNEEWGIVYENLDNLMDNIEKPYNKKANFKIN